MRYGAVIFDLDGTLLDSIEGIAETANFLLKNSGFPVFSREEYKKFVGDGLEKLVYRILPRNKRGELDRYVWEYRKLYKKTWQKKTRVYKGVRELLNFLSERKIKKAVLSNKSDEFAKIMVKKLLPEDFFGIIWGERSGIPRKPDPYAALQIASKFSMNPENVLMVGDSGIDMQTAKNAGMVPVGVAWGLREAGELLEQGACRVISKPLDLLDFFTEIY